MAYNSKLLSKEELPKSYEDILKPKWKAKIGLDDRGYIWIQLVASGKWSEEKGLDFAKKMLAQKPFFATGGTRIVQFLVAGEFSIGVTYLDKIIAFKRKGAPIEWIPLEPVVGYLYGRGIPKGAAHPHAAVLFVGWLATPEGQQSLEKYTARCLPLPGMGTKLSQLLEGKEQGLVGYGAEADKMGDMETKFRKVWGME